MDWMFAANLIATVDTDGRWQSTWELIEIVAPCAGLCIEDFRPQDRADRARFAGCPRLVAKTPCGCHPARPHATSPRDGREDMAPSSLIACATKIDSCAASA